MTTRQVILVISGIIIYFGSLIYLFTYGGNHEKFRITDNRGNCFYTNDTVTENGKCVSFMDSNNQNVKICGSYTIRDNKK
jgi:hypothetical protein